MRTSKARTGLRAGYACHRRWSACGKHLPFGPEVGAVCGKAACTDLCGGREATRVPTATDASSSRWLVARRCRGREGGGRSRLECPWLVFYGVPPLLVQNCT